MRLIFTLTRAAYYGTLNVRDIVTPRVPNRPGAYLRHDGQVVVRDEPHGPAGLAPLPLEELPQQPLHLAVAGVRALHRLLGVQTVSRGGGQRERERDTSGHVPHAV